MPSRITAAVLEAFLHCRYKGHLKQAGQMGTRSNYEILADEQRAAVRQQAIERITTRHADGEVISTVPLTASTLKQGAAFVLDATLEDDTFSLRFDGLKKVDGPSKLGDFHYIPVLFHGGGSVRKEQRLLLDVYGLLLSRIQGRTPGHGIVWHGRECRATKVRLSPDPRKAERLLRDLQQSQDAEPPRLVLNDHCQVCEFRRRCHDQAVREDNLSLLRGLGEKEVRGYARKGILTLTQLAHTFRPRRKGKRAVRRTHHRYHALQALAIRDKRVYVFGTPAIPDAPAKIYLDIEGLPDEGFVYLIGMTVVEGGAERHLAFWADTRDQEPEIFEQFLAEVSKHPDARLFCYGSYERTFLKRMRKAAGRKGPVDRVLAGLVNVLSVVYAHVYFPCYSNGLKDVAGCLGCSWSDPDASGLQSVVWRKRWEADHADEWKQKLVTYNREDCVALRKVAEFLAMIGTTGRDERRDEARGQAACRSRRSRNSIDWGPSTGGVRSSSSTPTTSTSTGVPTSTTSGNGSTSAPARLTEGQAAEAQTISEPNAPGQSAGPDRRPEVPGVRGHGRRTGGRPEKPDRRVLARSARGRSTSCSPPAGSSGG